MWKQGGICDRNPAIVHHPVGHRRIRIVNDAYLSPLAPKPIRDKLAAMHMERLGGLMFSVEEKIGDSWQVLQRFARSEEARQFVGRLRCS